MSGHNREFARFMRSEERTPPQILSDRILEEVRADLNPLAWGVCLKLAMVHALTGTATLLVCPQFGVGFLPGMGLMEIFMRFGPFACMMACGALFLGTSGLIASILLRPEEIRVLRRHELWLFSLLALVSLLTFMGVGTGFAVSLAGSWLLGSILGALLAFELGWRLRSAGLRYY